MTVSATLLEFERPSVGSETKTPSESVPVEPVVGADVSPLKAAFRLAIVPVAVSEAEPLVPVVKLNPVVEPRVSLPCETDSESESELLTRRGVDHGNRAAVAARRDERDVPCP